MVLEKVELAKNGSLEFQYGKGFLCKIVDDSFCPAVPDNASSSIPVLISYLHKGHYAHTRQHILMTRHATHCIHAIVFTMLSVKK